MGHFWVNAIAWLAMKADISVASLANEKQVISNGSLQKYLRAKFKSSSGKAPIRASGCYNSGIPEIEKAPLGLFLKYGTRKPQKFRGFFLKNIGHGLTTVIYCASGREVIGPVLHRQCNLSLWQVDE